MPDKVIRLLGSRILRDSSLIEKESKAKERLQVFIQRACQISG